MKAPEPKREDPPNGFAKLFNAVVDSAAFAALSGGAMKTYAILLRHSNENGESWPGVERIAKAVGRRSESSVREHLAELVKAGFIERLTRGGTFKSARYRVCEPNAHRRKTGSAQDSAPPENKRCANPDAKRAPPEIRSAHRRKSGDALKEEQDPGKKTTLFESGGNPPSRPAKKKRTRPPDPLFDALTEVYPRPETQSEHGKYSRVVKELRQVGATPEEVRTRAQECRRRYPKGTVNAVATHWAELAEPQDTGPQAPKLARFGGDDEPYRPEG